MIPSSCQQLQLWFGLRTFLILQTLTATTRLQAVKAINLNTLYPSHLSTLAP